MAASRRGFRLVSHACCGMDYVADAPRRPNQAMVATLGGLHDLRVRRAASRRPPPSWLARPLLSWPDAHRANPGPGIRIGSRRMKESAVAAQPSSKAAPELPRYLRAAEVAAILQVSPKTVSRWAKEGKLPFLKTLGGHRRYPAAEIRQLADELQVSPTT
jgi:excisionase family DNA binding protein